MRTSNSQDWGLQLLLVLAAIMALVSLLMMVGLIRLATLGQTPIAVLTLAGFAACDVAFTYNAR